MSATYLELFYIISPSVTYRVEVTEQCYQVKRSLQFLLIFYKMHEFRELVSVLSFRSLDSGNVTDCCVHRLQLNSDLNSTSYLLSQNGLITTFCAKL